jgi:hypothetical protein
MSIPQMLALAAAYGLVLARETLAPQDIDRSSMPAAGVGCSRRCGRERTIL